MSNPSTMQGDYYFPGNVKLADVTLPDDCVSDSEIPAGADIDALKLEHIHSRGYSQPNTTATTETKVIHMVVGATGSILDFKAGLLAACTGAATVTIDLKKSSGGGAFASVLSGVISLGSGDAAITPKAGLIATPGLVVGDVLEIVITATAGGGVIGTGLFVNLRVREDAQ